MLHLKINNCLKLYLIDIHEQKIPYIFFISMLWNHMYFTSGLREGSGQIKGCLSDNRENLIF